jgi:hypothetical protein
MRVEASETQELILTDCTPPDGCYHGVWSGFLVSFVGGGRSFKATTKIGVKGKCDCVVCVDQGNVIVSNG